MSIGQRFLEVRKSRRLKQTDVAEACGISHGALVNYENGLREPPTRVIVAFGSAYLVDLNWLLTGVGRSEAAELVQLHQRSIEAAWALLFRDVAVDADKLVRLAGALFCYLLEHHTISDAMASKLHALMEPGSRALPFGLSGDRP